MSLVEDEKTEDNKVEVKKKEYLVVSVEKSEAPEGAEGRDWYRYVIARENSTVVGNIQGTLQQVTSHAKSFAEDLNSRSGGQGRSMWSPRQKK